MNLMKKKELKHIAGCHYKKLGKQIDKLSDGIDAEALHQFRVDYKKFRAFLRMISSGNMATDEIKTNKELKDLYVVCGTIRDFLLQQQRIKKEVNRELKNTASYIKLLQKKIAELSPEIEEIISQKPLSKLKRKTDSKLPETFLPVHFRKFVKQKWNSIYLIILSGDFSDDNVHLVRKQLKDLLYCLEIYEGLEYQFLSVTVFKGKDKSYFENLLDDLGIFQDRCTSVALLKSYWFTSFPAQHREQLESIKKKWIKEKTLLKKRIIKNLKLLPV